MEATSIEMVDKVTSGDLLRLLTEFTKIYMPALGILYFLCGIAFCLVCYIFYKYFKDNIKNFYQYIKGTRELTLEEKLDLLDDNVQTLLSKFKYHFEYDEGADEDD